MPASPSPPVRPKKLRGKLTENGPISRFSVLLAMACFAAGANYVAFTNFVSVKDDLWLNSHGTLAKNPYLHSVPPHGHNLPELCAYYDTRQDKPYSKCIRLWFPLVLVDENSPQIVHYNPASPEHISTSWGRQILFSRICASLVFLLSACFIDLCILIYILQRIAGKEPSPVSSPPSSQPDQSASPGTAAARANASSSSSARKLSTTPPYRGAAI